MTPESFLAFYPQFSCLPSGVLSFHTNAANARFENLEESAEEARLLYTAHKLTLYAKTSPESSGETGSASAMAALASAGVGTKITSQRVENVSVTYASSAAASSSGSLAELEETLYGRQLLALIKPAAFPVYIP